MQNTHHKLIVLGSGPAGATAAIYAARAGFAPLLIRGNTPGGQLTVTTEVENYPGFVHVQGPELVAKMEEQAAHCGTHLHSDHIVKAELDSKPFRLTGQTGTEYTCDALIIATGATAKWLGLQSEQTFNGRGVSACATCDGAFYRNQDVAVVGGGNTAMEEALYLANLCKSVTLIHRRDAFRGEKVLQERVKNHPKITIVWNSTVDEILGDTSPTGGVTGLRLKSTVDGSTSELKVFGLFVAIGHKPNTDIFQGQLDMDDTGYLTVQPGTVFTKIKGVFAAGDVADSVYRQAVTAAGLGCMAALDAARYLEAQH
ncbi:MAG TPA: thioredoxin-disulfide reductase [Alphaproteobacteria bacterium]|nr:thioredoxin-disulfide reductase [Alphaproteobacteria bacterium]